MISQAEHRRVVRLMEATIAHALRGLGEVESVDYPIDGRIDARLKSGADVSVSIDVSWSNLGERAPYGAVAQADGAAG